MYNEISEQFEELGIEPSNEVLEKCTELCLTHNITDPVEFVELWVAYSLNHLNGAEPTIQYLSDFGRKELAIKKKDVAYSTKDKMSTNSDKNLEYEMNSIPIYGNIGDTGGGILSNNSLMDVQEDIMDSYSCKTPKAIKTAVSRTPASKNDVLFSPVSYSPIGTPRSLAESSGKVVYTFGNPSLMSSANWISLKKINISINQLILHNNEPLTMKIKYLHDNLLEKIETSGEQIFQRGKEICQKVFESSRDDWSTGLENPDIPSQDLIKTVGTIFCEHDGKIDINSTILVGSDEMCLRSVRLNLSRAKPFGVFPGQTVMVSGTNPRGDTLLVEQIFTERMLVSPTPPKLDDQLSFIIAAGPFTHNDDFVYDPLHDLISYCANNKPDILLLCGPFMETEHPLVIGNILAETFESFFEKMISGIIEAIGTDTTILLISSSKDTISDFVYPTPPFSIKKNYPNVFVLPDPSMIDLNGVKIAMTSTDIVNDLINNEVFMNAGDKIKRATNYLFHQASFYPLNPSSESVFVDTGLAEKYAKLSEIPNIIILPSDQKCFIRDVNSCLSLNPGRLNDNKGGTFARLVIHPRKDEDKISLLNYVSCQILKV